MKRSMILFILFVVSCSPFSTEDLPLYTDVPMPDFNTNTLWYTRVDTNTVLSEYSDEIVAKMVSLREGGMSAVGNAEEWAIPVYFTDGTDDRVSVRLMRGWTWTNGIRLPMPSEARPDPADDSHLVILDTNNGIEFDFWQMKRFKGNWIAATLTAIDYRNDDDGVADIYGCRASDFALTSGLIWPHEILSTNINHALVFGYSYNRVGAVYPALDSDGWANDTAAMPEGARIRLRSDFDVEAMEVSEYLKEVYRALQTYGAICGDNSGGFGFYMVNPQSFRENPYEAIPEYQWGHLRLIDFPFEYLEVLEFGTNANTVNTNAGIPFEEYYY